MMSRLKILRILLIIFLIIVGLSLLLMVVTRFTGCPAKTKVTRIENLQDINVKILPGSCTEKFILLSHESESLWLYAIKGDIITWNGSGKETVNNVIICLGSLDFHKGYLSRDELGLEVVNEPNSCAPVGLETNQEYFFENVKGDWELYTDKGNITGFTEYKPIRINQNAFLTFKISLLILIILSIIYYLLSYLIKRKIQ